MAAVASGNPTVMSASSFVIQVDGIQVATFSELSGISTGRSSGPRSETATRPPGAGS